MGANFPHDVDCTSWWLTDTRNLYTEYWFWKYSRNYYSRYGYWFDVRNCYTNSYDLYSTYPQYSYIFTDKLDSFSIL
jgi:hypothetical protein